MATVGQIKRKTSELYKLRNRVERYETRLLKEAFTKAGQEGKNIAIGKMAAVDESTIFIHEQDEEPNIQPLLEYIREDMSSLYHKHKAAKRRLEQSFNKLERMLEEVKHSSWPMP